MGARWKSASFMPYRKDATEKKKKRERGEMLGEVLGPAVRHVALLCVFSAPGYNRGER